MEPQEMAAELALATACAEKGDATGALHAAGHVRQAARRQGDVATEARALHCIACVQLRLLGDFPAAFASAREAAFAFESASMTAEECSALATQAIAAARLGYCESAVDRALLAVRLCGDLPPGEVAVAHVAAHHALGVAMYVGGAYPEASAAWHRAIELAGQCQPPLDPYELHADLASAEVMRLHKARSSGATEPDLRPLAGHLGLCEAAPEAARRLSGVGLASRRNSTFTYAFNKSLLLIWQGDLQAGAAQLERLRDAVEAAGHAWLRALVRWSESELALARGELPEARACAARATDIAVAHGHEGLASIGLQQQAQLALLAGDPATAVQALRRLAQREQAARSASLRGRVADVEQQLALRRRTRELQASEAGRAHFEQLALQDGLTGLPNRRHFEREIQAVLTGVAKHGDVVCVAMIDVDRFKQINDTHSHNAGDAVLQALAALIRRCARRQDFPARLAGDEFVVILRDTGLAPARALVKRLMQQVAEYPWDGIASGLSVSLSLGLAEVQPGDTLHDVLSRSDRSMYADKRSKVAAR
jgi:diguanylate cyclase (GGDEF)-like protein